MIPVRELRIGNLINRNGIMEVRTIKETHIRVYDHYNRVSLKYYLPAEDFSGIELSEDWLKRMGFTQPNDWHCYRLFISEHDEGMRSSLQVGFVGCGQVQVCRSGINAYAASVQYVHQLQNLVHALTNSELSIEGIS